MCAITGSLHKNKLKELYMLNTYRGELSYSLSTFRPSKEKVQLQVLFTGEGSMSQGLLDDIPKAPEDYIIAHSQAPTTETKNIHPASYGDALLWHNGIIKQKNIQEGTWDTAWLLENIIDYGWSSLSRVDGTFACIMYLDSQLYIFRNEISPMFIDRHFNISSTKFEGGESLAPNKVWRMNFEAGSLDPVAYFDTFENPYYIPEAI